MKHLHTIKVCNLTNKFFIFLFAFSLIHNTISAIPFKKSDIFSLRTINKINLKTNTQKAIKERFDKIKIKSVNDTSNLYGAFIIILNEELKGVKPCNFYFTISLLDKKHSNYSITRFDYNCNVTSDDQITYKSMGTSINRATRTLASLHNIGDLKDFLSTPTVVFDTLYIDLSKIVMPSSPLFIEVNKNKAPIQYINRDKMLGYITGQEVNRTFSFKIISNKKTLASGELLFLNEKAKVDIIQYSQTLMSIPPKERIEIISCYITLVKSMKVDRSNLIKWLTKNKLI